MFNFHKIALFGPFFYIADDEQAVLHAVQDETRLFTQNIHAVDDICYTLYKKKILDV